MTELSQDRLLNYSDLTLDVSAHTVHRGKNELKLTVTEFALLELLMRNAGQSVKTQRIIEEVWKFEATDYVVRTHVYKTRLKTEAHGGRRLIHSITRTGYILLDTELTGP